MTNKKQTRTRDRVFFLLLPVLLLVFTMDIRAQTEATEHRIISLAPHITELLFAVGAGDQVVGVVSFSDYPEAAKSLPQIGSYNKMNYEAILASEPTLVLGWDSGNGEDSLARLRELGLNVYSHELKTLEDVAKSLQVIGELTGHKAQGVQQSKLFLEKLAVLKAKYSGQSPVSVYYQLWNEPQMTVNDEHLISDVIALCGGDNIFADAIPLVPKVSVETVLRRNPELIVATGMAGERPEWLDDWRRWSSISAVEHNHLYHIHPDLLHRHSPRILDGAALLCEYLARVRRADSNTAQ